MHILYMFVFSIQFGRSVIYDVMFPYRREKVLLILEQRLQLNLKLNLIEMQGHFLRSPKKLIRLDTKCIHDLVIVVATFVKLKLKLPHEVDHCCKDGHFGLSSFHQLAAQTLMAF